MGDTTCTPKLTRKKSLETVGSKSSMKWVSREKWFRTWPTRPGFIIKTDEWWREASGTAALQIYVVNRCQFMGLLPDTQNCGLRMLRECCERFSRHRSLAIPTCITARAWRTCRDVCRSRLLVVSFEVGGGENVPSIPGACAIRNFAYLVRGPCCLDILLTATLFHKFITAVNHIFILIAVFRESYSQTHRIPYLLNSIRKRT